MGSVLTAAPAAGTTRGRLPDGAVWAGLVGAIAVLIAGLAQAEQTTGGAIAAAIIAGSPFAPLFLSERRNGPEGNPRWSATSYPGDGRGRDPLRDVPGRRRGACAGVRVCRER